MSLEESRIEEPTLPGGYLGKLTLKDFNELVINAIEDTITSLLSPTVLHALYEHLRQHHSISRSDLPDRLDTLRFVLRRAIGFQASMTVERAIARALFTSLKLRFNSRTGYTLIDYVQEAKALAAERDRIKPDDESWNKK